MPKSVARCVTKRSVSSNVPSSSRKLIRSRAESLPSLCWRSRLSWPPPASAAASRRLRSSSFCSRFIGRPIIEDRQCTTSRRCPLLNLYRLCRISHPCPMSTLHFFQWQVQVWSSFHHRERLLAIAVKCWNRLDHAACVIVRRRREHLLGASAFENLPAIHDGNSIHNL